MARNDVYLNINALSPADAVVTGQQDMTAATVPELVLGDTPTFNFLFTDNTNVWPSWAGNASYSLTWALSDAVAGDFSPAATTGNATPITGGWSVVLPLNSYDLVGLLNTKRVGQPYPVTNLWQQLRVTDPSGNEVTRAMFWTPVRYRAISDTQNTESASPTGGRFVTVNNVNTLTTPTAAQFYAANPVPTSALGTAANGELLIGNGTGFTKSTLTAGTGITVTNGSGSITIDATGAQETLTATVKNAESVAITKGQVVYLFGATGGFASVKLAYNTSDATSAKTFGVVSSTSIAANGTGTVTCVGVVDGLNLGAYNDGDTLYLGATPGSVTATKPYAPNHLVYVGIVERANNGNGELYVRVQNGYELDEIHDVQITAPKLAGQTLIYDQTNDLWKNARLTGTANQITVTNADAAVTLSIPTNPTLPGNLTVSGTGTSTFGGNLTVSGTGTSSVAGRLDVTKSLNLGGAAESINFIGLNRNVLGVIANSAIRAYNFYNDGTQLNIESYSGSGVMAGTASLSATQFRVNDSAGGSRFAVTYSSGDTTVGGNLTVSGAGGVNVASNTKFWSINQAAYYYIPQSGLNTGDLDAVNGIRLLKGGTAVLTAGNSTDGNVTVTNNLTVSGTGTSTFSGDIKIQKANAQLEIRSASDAAGQFQYLTFGSPNYNRAQFRSNNQGVADGAISLYTFDAGIPVIAQYWTKSGNSLLGTTTDSGNGKLQLATHSTSAGGIGFGTDQTIYRYNSTAMGLAGVTDLFIQSGNSGLWLGSAAGSYQVGIARSASSGLTFYTGSAGLALTLDSSQRMLTAGMAAFGGTTFLNLASWANGSSGFGENNLDKAVIGYLKSSTNGATIAGHTWPLTGWAPLNIAGSNLTFRTNGELIALTLDSSQNATFAGSIRQNQANNISLTSGVATTIFSLGTSAGVYIVTATLDVNGNSGYAIVGKGATGNWQVLANSGSQISFSMSTNDLQITQTSGATSTTNTFNLLRLR